MSSRRLIILATTTITLLAVIVGGSYFLSLTVPLTVTYNALPGSEVSLTSENETVINRLESGKEYRIGSGKQYSILVDGKDIEKQSIAINVTDKPVKRDITIEYSKSYLDAELEKEQAAIAKVLKTTYPAIDTLYAIRKGTRLYLDGTWYATQLRYIGTDNLSRDTLKLIMQKKNGQWHLVTKPPQIIISKKDYPGIPGAVIDIINETPAR